MSDKTLPNSTIAELPDSTIAELERLLAEATPGRWTPITPDGITRVYAVDPATGHPIAHVATVGAEDEVRADAALIVAAANNLRALLDEVARLRRIEAAARVVLGHVVVPPWPDERLAHALAVLDDDGNAK